jgi:hypothetical protein
MELETKISSAPTNTHHSLKSTTITRRHSEDQVEPEYTVVYTNDGQMLYARHTDGQDDGFWLADDVAPYFGGWVPASEVKGFRQLITNENGKKHLSEMRTVLTHNAIHAINSNNDTLGEALSAVGDVAANIASTLDSLTTLWEASV